MRSYLPFLMLFILSLLVLTSCSNISAPAITPTPTEDIAATQAYERAQVATVLANRRTEEALQMTVTAQKLTVEAREALAQTATEEAAQREKTLNAKATQAAQIELHRQGRTATAAVKMTEQVQPIYEIIQRLYQEEVISNMDGEYHRVDDFDQSWAQINWYQWWRTGLKLENFVIRTDAEWESASKTANWFSSGCGFVYSENGTDDHFASFLALDGNVYNSRVRHGIFSQLPGGYYGRLDTPKGKAEIMMVVDQTVVSFYVNGKRVSRFTDSTIDEGVFALTLNSGTNLDFGTRCKMTNVDIWELK
jgi:hypothetical protein